MRLLRAARSAGLGALAFVLACTTGTTLDERPGASPQPDTGATEEDTEMEPDVPLAPQLGCEPGCSMALAADWTYEGPGGQLAMVDVARGDNGELVVATRRAVGGFWLVALTAEGIERYALSPGLGCPGCELADVAVLPSGDVLLSLTMPGSFGPEGTQLVRFDPAAGAVRWQYTKLLDRFTEIQAEGAGPVAVLTEDRFATLRMLGGGSEAVQVMTFDGDGNELVQRHLRSQPAWPRPRYWQLEPSPHGELVVAGPLWTVTPEGIEEPAAFVSRLLPPAMSDLSTISVPLVLDDLAIDRNGRRVELSRSEGQRSVTLLLRSYEATDPLRWESSLPLVSASSTRASVAVGPNNDVYAATRITPQGPGQDFFGAQLVVAAWTEQGELRGQATIGLELSATDRPLELTIDDEHGIVVGAVVEGELRVIRYRQECACD